MSRSIEGVLIGCLVLVSACKPREAVAVYEACYRRCTQPPPGECQPGHDWCIRACQPGQELGPRVVAATVTEVPGKVGRFPMLLSHSIGLETLGGVFTPLIKQCTRLPAEISEVFSTAVDNQSQVQIAISSGEASLVQDNTPLGLFFLREIPPAKRGTPQIRVTFRIEPTGALAVTAKDLLTGNVQTVAVNDL